MRLLLFLENDESNQVTDMQFVDVSEDNVYLVTSKSGKKSSIVVQDFPFEVLFEVSSHAVLDGYYREAVTSISASLERFYETFIGFYFFLTADKSFEFEEWWKPISNQSERQLGAFCVAYTALFKESAPLLSSKEREFRNKVVHKGVFPTRLETLAYGQSAGKLIVTMLLRLYEHHQKEFDSYRHIFLNNRAKIRKETKADYRMVMPVSRVIGLTWRNQWSVPWDFESQLVQLEKFRLLRLEVQMRELIMESKATTVAKKS